VLSELEDRYVGFHGINLTYAVYEGILRHSTYFDRKEEIKGSITDDIRHDVKKYWNANQPGIETQIVSIADVIAYAAHDIEDALANGLILWDDFKKRLNEKRVRFVYDLATKVENDVSESKNPKEWTSKVRPRILARYLINALMQRVARQAKDDITKLNTQNGELHEQIRNLESEVVALPQDFETQVKILVEDILYNDVYTEPRVIIMAEKARMIMDLLFNTMMNEKLTLPTNTRARLGQYENEVENGKRLLSKDKILPTVVADYMAGMTDKYAMDLYQLLSQPYEKVL